MKKYYSNKSELQLLDIKFISKEGSFIVKYLKKNQLVILVIALMLVTAGYLNYTANGGENFIQTGGQIANLNLASIGDAELVNSDEIIKNIEENKVETSSQETNKEQEIQANSNTNNEKQDDYFTASRLGRDTMYSQMIESYQKVLTNTNISEEQKTISTQEIANINATKNAIMISENLIKTKGFDDCIIFVNDKSISVIIKAETLTQEQIAQVQNIISREMKAEIDNIHISNK